jgi:hypothetical protein
MEIKRNLDENARKKLEKESGRKVSTRQNYLESSQNIKLLEK